MKSIDVGAVDNKGLQNLIENHRRNGLTAAPLYLEALAELERRRGKGLDFDKSREIILRAAREGRFLSYKELADASGAEWQKVHYSINRHLGDLVEYAYRQGWPLISAIVVNKPNVATGEMEESALKGFISIVRQLKIPVTDEVAFLKDQQRAVFEWASRLSVEQPGGDSPRD